jgi:truncated hemoglobin YjbI
MSKLALQKRAEESSGVSYQESAVALQLEPSLYDRIGSEGFYQLSTLFYNRVFADATNAWFINIFASSTKQEAIDNQYRFLVQTFGGPDLYKTKKGKYTRLVGRHANYNIGVRAAERWMQHMVAALDELFDNNDKEVKHALQNYFQYTAHYIVVASEYMRPDQVRPNASYGSRLITARVASWC